MNKKARSILVIQRKAKRGNETSCFKVDGFTLLEMLFVILLTSIVVSLAFAYFNIFQKYIVSQNTAVEYEMQVMRFETLMHYDIDRADHLELDRRELNCAGTGVTYELNETNIIRYQYEATDTLWGNSIEYEPIIPKEYKKLICGIAITVLDENDRQRNYFFTKLLDEKTKFDYYQSDKD